MSWRELKNTRGGPGAMGVKVSVRVDVTGQKVNIAFGEDVCGQLPWLRPGKIIAVYVGEDEHLGKLRITPSNDGRKLARSKKDTDLRCNITLTAWDLETDSRMSAKVCDYTVGQNDLVIELPEVMWKAPPPQPKGILGT